MKLRLIPLVLAALAAGPAFANADLAKAKSCLACHDVEKKVVGPSYKDIAARYTNDKGAVARLADKIQNGGGGVWGALKMPANAVTPEEARTLAAWVLSQK